MGNITASAANVMQMLALTLTSMEKAYRLKAELFSAHLKHGIAQTYMFSNAKNVLTPIRSFTQRPKFTAELWGTCVRCHSGMTGKRQNLISESRLKQEHAVDNGQKRT